jgi:hypothetical protein
MIAWYIVLLALANFVWAAQGTAVKILEPHLGPIAITFVPFWITTILLIPLLLRQPNRVKPTPKDWGAFAIAGVGGQVRHSQFADSRDQRCTCVLTIKGKDYSCSHRDFRHRPRRSLVDVGTGSAE